MTTKIHPTAIIEDNVRVGPGTAVWDHVHIRRDTTLGAQCIVGGKSMIAYGVTIGDRVKINSLVYVCHGVTIEDGVLVGAGTVFTNDRFPRATTTDLQRLLPSEPDEATQTTLVRCGSTIGAGCVIGCGLEIGRFAMVGMGSVVTRTVPDFHLVIGNPARSAGCVCKCGWVLARSAPGEPLPAETLTCLHCGLRYCINEGRVTDLESLDSQQH